MPRARTDLLTQNRQVLTELQGVAKMVSMESKVITAWDHREATTYSSSQASAAVTQPATANDTGTPPVVDEAARQSRQGLRGSLSASNRKGSQTELMRISTPGLANFRSPAGPLVVSGVVVR